jgi:hypothetical protein
MTNPSFVNRVETLPPIGASDHDIVYSEINLALPQNKQQAHKVLNQLSFLVGYLPEVILICCQCFLLEYAYG